MSVSSSTSLNTLFDTNRATPLKTPIILTSQIPQDPIFGPPDKAYDYFQKIINDLARVLQVPLSDSGAINKRNNVRVKTGFSRIDRRSQDLMFLQPNGTPDVLFIGIGRFRERPPLPAIGIGWQSGTAGSGLFLYAGKPDLTWAEHKLPPHFVPRGINDGKGNYEIVIQDLRRKTSDPNAVIPFAIYLQKNATELYKLVR